MQSWLLGFSSLISLRFSNSAESIGGTDLMRWFAPRNQCTMLRNSWEVGKLTLYPLSMCLRSTSVHVYSTIRDSGGFVRNIVQNVRYRVYNVHWSNLFLQHIYTATITSKLFPFIQDSQLRIKLSFTWFQKYFSVTVNFEILLLFLVIRRKQAWEAISSKYSSKSFPY